MLLLQLLFMVLMYLLSLLLVPFCMCFCCAGGLSDAVGTYAVSCVGGAGAVSCAVTIVK